MDALIRQMRTRSRTRGPSQPEEGRDGVSGASSRTGEKINKSWFQRQYSKQMNGNSGDHGPGGEDEIAIAIAIAAAAYAVDSLDEPDNGGAISRGDSAFVRAKSKREMIPQQEPYGSPTPFSGQREPPFSSSSRGIQDGKEQKVQRKPSNVGDGPVKTVQKRPTFAEKLQLDRTNSSKAEQSPQEGEDEENLPIPLPNPNKRRTSSSAMNPVALPPQAPPPLPPKFPATNPGNPPLFEIESQPRADPSATRYPAAQLEKPQQKRQIGEGSTGGAAEADAWERYEMNRIRVKYEKLIGTIATWEDDKKKSTRRKLDENEREIERRRVKAQKEFRTEMERIGQVAGGARAQADERRKLEEAKTREKAERIRGTRKAPSKACSCF